MSVAELKKAYDELKPDDQLLFATLVAADQMIKTDEFKSTIERRHRAMDEGKKWSQSDVLRLHEELSKQAL
jgi:DNA phosphorothioation-dependent restriction protein DptG